MTSAANLLFFIIIPVICVIFRVNKKINTGFTISGILTSFLLGIIVAGSFTTDPANEFIKYINNNDIENAKLSLKQILQDKPEYLEKIKKHTFANPELYITIKNDIVREYQNTAGKYIQKDFNIQKVKCDKLSEEKSKLANLENAARLLNMAGKIGEDQTANIEILEEKMFSGKKILKELEVNCGDTEK